MKKFMALAAAVALALMLSACGGADSASALQDRADELTKQNAALQEENQKLQSQLETQAAGSESTAGTSAGSDTDDNPIDRFFSAGGYRDDSTTVVMDYVEGCYRDAWQAEMNHLAEEIKSGLTYDADKALADDYIAAAEEQVTRMESMALFVCADTGVAPDQRIGTAGTIRGVLWADFSAGIYRDTFFQLMAVSPYANEGGYAYVFDADAVKTEMDATLKG